MRDTLAQLSAYGSARSANASAGGLSDFASAGSNPGALGARMYVPEDLPAGAPLVVVLHGCTQSADGYDLGTGWSRLADRAGFALLFPEQRRANNANLCFNWFQSADIARLGGEAESVAQMVEAMIVRHALDRQRIFVTGLSAGGAMAAVMLATYPDVFAGGAILSGLPYGCAQGVGQALERMAGRNYPAGRAGVDAVARLPHAGPASWPTVSIWHGTADATVVVGNMDELAAQWCGVHGVDAAADRVERGDNWEHRSWTLGDRTVVETWRVAGMGHGVPIDPTARERLGSAGPYMLPVGIDSTAAIAQSWGLVQVEADATEPTTAPQPAARRRAVPAAIVPPAASRVDALPGAGIQAVIEDALRSAGLMR